MDVEKKIFTLIPYLLKKYDKRKIGVAIDIGVGTFNFYCEVFKDEGFNTYAIEPLPSENLQKLVKERNINLISACITGFNGKIMIYSGQFHGSQSSDLSSIHKSWWGVNEQSNVSLVDSIRLEKLFSEYSIDQITYMKIDTEGSEWEIISQFQELDRTTLPKIVEFEYGGGASKHEQKAGWSQEYFSKTIDCISTLKECGYKYVLVFDREENQPLFYTLRSLRNIKHIFKETYVYGNLIFFKEKKFSNRKISLLFNGKTSIIALFKKFIKTLIRKVSI